MVLEQYGDLSEKCKFFQSGSATLNSLGTLKSILKEYSSKKYSSFYFRGVGNARYKMYNSAQRSYLSIAGRSSEELYKNFIIKLILDAQVWGGGKIRDLMRSIGIADSNWISYLSLLQHSGMPSPCLDFSTDPYVAAYFAFKNAEFVTGEVIDEYCSIYIFDSNSKLFSMEISDLLETVSNEKGISNEDVINMECFNALFYAGGDMISKLTDSPRFQMYNSLNILAQKGRLVFYSSHIEPLEIVVSRLLGKCNYSDLKCLNIHISMREEVLEYLSERGCNSKSLLL